jgi:hypothetical protein
MGRIMESILSVILSGASASRREAETESKDLVLDGALHRLVEESFHRREFLAQPIVPEHDKGFFGCKIFFASRKTSLRSE